MASGEISFEMEALIQLNGIAEVEFVSGLGIAVARQLNERPRKRLEYETTAERFNACVAFTG